VEPKRITEKDKNGDDDGDDEDFEHCHEQADMTLPAPM
jgi:hypothetical protein